MTAEAKQLVLDNLRGIPDFPKPGILFWDVTTLLLDAKVFQATIDAFVEQYKDKKIDVIAGVRPHAPVPAVQPSPRACTLHASALDAA
jgi:adenine/guanine phosphoribosyltransferase-like PRPP-binding protein